MNGDQTSTTAKRFVHLQVHSYYSFFDSTLSPARIVQLAVDAGMASVALTDTNNLSAAVEFYKEALERGVRPILGAEVTEPLPREREIIHERSAIKGLADGEDLERSLCDEEDSSSGGSISPMLMHGNRECCAVFLARNFAGYSILSRLVTRRHLASDFSLKEELSRVGDDLIVLSDSPKVIEWAAESGRRESLFWVMLAPSRRRCVRIRNRIVYELARRHGLPLIVTCDVKLATPADAPLHDLLQAMRKLTTVENLGEDARVDPARYFQDEATVREYFHADTGTEQIHRDISQAIANTGVIAELCDCRLPIGEWKFPRFTGLAGDPATELRRQVEEGVMERYGDPPSEEARLRMNRELQVIQQLNFTDYFLLVRRIVEEARSRGYHTIGRGSAANSIVTYALGISNVCPIRYNLYFERFLNPERSAPPDIDLDFSWKERDNILDWCFDFFGRERVALISTFQTLRSRQAIREVAKALGLCEAEVTEFNRLHETHFCTEENTLHDSPPRIYDLSHEEPWRTTLQWARQITGFPHHLSVHCGGIVIAPGHITDYMPLTSSAKGYAITQMDMIGVEDMGLIKMDLLGNRSLGVLKDTITMAEANAGHRGASQHAETPSEAVERTPLDTRMFQREAARIKLAGTRRGTSVALAGVLESFGNETGTVSRTYETVHERAFDFELVTSDTATRALIDSGRTMGVFYIESPGMRALFERLRCRSFEEVVAASSIIRPGVAESGMMREYIERRQHSPSFEDLCSPTTLLPASTASERLASGAMPVNAHAKTRVTDDYAASARPGFRKEAKIHPLMLELLPETYGVMVYQEDVLRVAHDLAGMSYAEADLLRRAMSGKMRSKDAMERIHRQFFSGAASRGIRQEDAEEIWRQIASFSGYSFCKGHSAAFAVLSYQIAYLKAHHPAEFFAALLSNEGGFYGAAAYIEEARRWGMEIRPPCVNESSDDYTGETFEAGMGCGQGWVRVGLRAIAGLSTATRQSIVCGRQQGGPYQSLHDFIMRSNAGEEECRTLVKVGALRALSDGGSCAQLLMELDLRLNQRALARTGNLFALFTPTMLKPSQVRTNAMPGYRQYEQECLGFMVDGHPLDYARIPDGVVTARDIRAYAGKWVRMAGWMIAAKLLETRNGRGAMKMLTLEDRTDTFEAVLFPRIYKRFIHRTLTRGPYLVEGKVDVSLGSPTLNVEQITLLPSRQSITHSTRITCSID